MLTVDRLSVRYGELTILDELSLSVDAGQWWMVIGPNGAGKSTLVNAIAQAIPYTGSVLFDGENVKAWRSKQLARRIGILAQSHAVGYAFTVEEVVRLGRYAHTAGALGGGDAEGEEKIAAALKLTGLIDKRRQSVLTLSGGELQRCFLAQVFAQEPQLLLLDEPANHLDLIYQRQLFDLITNWLKTPKRAVVSVVHDLSHAKAYGSHALLIDHGRAAACGTVREVLTGANLDPVYGMDVYAWMQSQLLQWREDEGTKGENHVGSCGL